MRNFVFLWFLVSMLAVAAILAIGVFLSGPTLLLAAVGRFGSGLVHYGAGTAVMALDTGGVPALEALEKRIDARGAVRFYVLDSSHQAAGGREVPGPVREFSSRIQSGVVEFMPFGQGLLAGCIVDSKDGARRVILSLPRRGYDIPINIGGWIVRVIAVLCGAILFCSWLARRLSAPLQQIRQAARKVASGDLDARVNALTLPANPPEYRQLAGEFDEMAGRIDALVSAQRRLLRDVSHELLTPITRLNLAVNNARLVRVPAVEVSLDRIEQESERLTGLVKRIIRLSRLEAFAEAPHCEVIDVADLVESIVSDADFEATARSRRVAMLRCEPCRTSGDRELLREAIENLVRNAIRYAPEESTVTVDAYFDVTDGTVEYLIAVRDRGPGVPAEHIRAIFEPFYRAPQRGGSDTQGFGIGLAIAKRAVGLHHGRLTATNLAEGGFEIMIRIPAATSRS